MQLELAVDQLKILERLARAIGLLQQDLCGRLPNLANFVDADFGFLYPAAQYDHEEGFAVVGGFVYRGSLVPELTGHYVFGDIVGGRIFHVPVAELLGADPLTGAGSAQIGELTLVAVGMETTLLAQVDDDRADLRFGIDAEGEIYILTKSDGRVRTLLPEPGAAASGLAALLGLVSLAGTGHRTITA